MNNRLKILLPLILALVLILCLQLIFMFVRKVDKLSLFNKKKISPVEQVWQLIKSNYVDTIGGSELKNGTIEDLVSKLDPHTAYLPPSEEAEMREMLLGNFGGIGVEFFVIRDTVWIVDVVKGSPSHQAGIKKGDKIIAVNDTSIAGNKIEDKDIFNKLRGIEGTPVKLLLLRGKTLINAQLTRGAIPSPSLETAFMVDKEMGYIKLARLSGTTYKEFVDAMTKLKAQGLKKLILDLRGNGGGLLDEATSIADEFIDQHKIIVYTQGRVFGREDFKSRVAGVFEEGPLEVLVDEGSASASEVIAGALQDHDRAMIIGRRTYGKGLVQQQYKLNNGGYLRLTVARYYTPSGRSIQKPYTKDDREEYYHEVMKRNNDSLIAYTDSTVYYTSMGREMHGSGGITPDVVVNDTLSPGSTFDYVTAGIRTIPELAYSYAAKNYNVLQSSYPNAESFINDYEVPEELLNKLATDLRGKESSFRDGYQGDVAIRLKAFIGRYLFDRTVLYRLLAYDDNIYQRAVKELRNPQFAFVRTAP